MDEVDGTGMIFTNFISFNKMILQTIFQAIVESQQLRRETETVGPTAELVYWRRLFGQFSSIMSHIKSSYIQAFIQLLTEAKSKLIKV